MKALTKRRVVFLGTQSGRAFERIHRPDGSYVLVADRRTHERALKAAGMRLREIVEANRRGISCKIGTM